MSALANGHQNLKWTQPFDEFTFVLQCVAKAFESYPAVEPSPIRLRNTSTLVVIQHRDLLRHTHVLRFANREPDHPKANSNRNGVQEKARIQQGCSSSGLRALGQVLKLLRC